MLRQSVVEVTYFANEDDFEDLTDVEEIGYDCGYGKSRREHNESLVTRERYLSSYRVCLRI